MLAALGWGGIQSCTVHLSSGVQGGEQNWGKSKGRELHLLARLASVSQAWRGGICTSHLSLSSSPPTQPRQQPSAGPVGRGPSQGCALQPGVQWQSRVPNRN